MRWAFWVAIFRLLSESRLLKVHVDAMSCLQVPSMQVVPQDRREGRDGTAGLLWWLNSSAENHEGGDELLVGGDFTPWYKNGINIEDKIIGYRG